MRIRAFVIGALSLGSAAGALISVDAGCSSFESTSDDTADGATSGSSASGGSSSGASSSSSSGDTGNGVKVLAMDLAGPIGITVDTTHVYWTNWSDGTIRRVDLDGANPLTMASGLNHPWAITTNGVYLYFAAFMGDIYRCPTAACPMPLPSTPHAPGWGARALALSQDNLVWTRSVEAAVTYCPISTCDYGMNDFVATNQGGPWAIAALPADAVWTNIGSNDIVKCPYTGCPDGGAPALATGLDRPVGIAVSGANVYWAEAGRGVIATCLLDNCLSPDLIAMGQDAPSAIAVDEANVYWTNAGTADGTGAVMWCAKASCKPQALGTKQDSPAALAIDADHVYVANRGRATNGGNFGDGYGNGVYAGGSIVRYPKPK